MEMSNVKAIFDNNVQKNVKKITDGNGNVIWRKNLFLGFDSPWCCDFSCDRINGMIVSEATESMPRATYFFACKPNTTYRYTAETPGDRFCVCTLKTLYDYPPAFIAGFPYRETADNVSIIENRNTQQINTTKDYTFTTGADDKMVYIYFALNTRPTGVRIVEV